MGRLETKNHWPLHFQKLQTLKPFILFNHRKKSTLGWMWKIIRFQRPNKFCLWINMLASYHSSLPAWPFRSLTHRRAAALYNWPVHCSRTGSYWYPWAHWLRCWCCSYRSLWPPCCCWCLWSWLRGCWRRPRASCYSVWLSYRWRPDCSASMYTCWRTWSVI